MDHLRRNIRFKKLRTVVVLGDGKKETRLLAKLLMKYLWNPIIFVSYHAFDIHFHGFDRKKGVDIMRIEKSEDVFWDICDICNPYCIFMDWYTFPVSKKPYPPKRMRHFLYNLERKRQISKGTDKNGGIIHNTGEYIQELDFGFNHFQPDVASRLQSYLIMMKSRQNPRFNSMKGKITL